jgi:hypothetical protein
MLVKYFNSNRAGLLFLIPAIAVILWLGALSHPLPVYTHSFGLDGPLGRLLIEPVSKIPFLSALFGMIVILLYGFLLVQLNEKYLFLSTRTQLPILFYVAICGGLNPLRFFSPALIAIIIIIFIIYRLFESYKKDKLAFHFLDAGILLGIAVLFYMPWVVLLPLLFIVSVVFRNTIWQEWIYPWIGFLLPFIFWISYLYLTDQSLQTVLTEFSKVFAPSSEQLSFSMLQMIYYGFLAFLVLLGSIHMVRTIGTRKIQVRAFFIVFWWLFLLSIAVLLIVPAVGVGIIYLGGIPISLLISNYFATCRNNRFNNFMFFLFLTGILMIVVNDWLNFIPGKFSI